MAKHFTRQEIEEIRMQLAQHGMKDTDFIETDKFTGDDYFVIVQDGQNKKISASTFRSDYNEIAEQDHQTAMADHQTADSDSAQAGRDHQTAVNDHAIAVADHDLVAPDHAQAEADSLRARQDHNIAVADHAIAVEDHNQAVSDSIESAEATTNAITAAALANAKAELVQDKLDTADQDHVRAESDHRTAATDHTIADGDHTAALLDHENHVLDHAQSAEDSRIAGINALQAQNDHTRAESDHNTALNDHTTAQTDHGVAVADHNVATDDHVRGTQDHTRAETDHATAVQDHTTATSDHNTAVQDHTTASSDHTRAESDHTRAEQDHTESAAATGAANVAAQTATEAAEAADTARESIEGELAKKANVEGYYGGLTAGSAENLVGRGSVDAEYAGIRTSAGSADIGSGSASVVRMKGNSFKWNQLAKDIKENRIDNTVTAENVGEDIVRFTSKAEGATYRYWLWDWGTKPGVGHKVYVSVELTEVNQPQDTTAIIGLLWCKAGHNGTSYILAKNADGLNPGRYGSIQTVENAPFGYSMMMGYTFYSNSGSVIRFNQADGGVAIRNIVMIDLTAVFGQGSEPSTVEEFDAWREEMGLTLDYYDYNPGEVINNRAAAIETVGFNRYNPETGKAFLPGKYSDYPQEYEICGTFTSISFRDINGNESVPTLTAGRFFNVDAPGELTVVGGNATDTLVHLVWSGWRNQGEPDYAFEPYRKNTLNLNLTTLTGKLNGAGNSVVVFPHGLAKVGNVQDEIVGNKAIKRIGVVDLGTLNWTRYDTQGDHWRFGVIVSSIPVGDGYKSPNFMCLKYEAITPTQTYTGIKGISNNYGVNQILVCDSSYTDAEAFKAAMQGVLLYYELATPEEYILDTTPEWNYRVDDFGTERVIPSYSQSELTAPISYDVQYAMNAVDAIRRLPDNYVERADVKQTPGTSDKFVLSQKGVEDNYAKKVGVENDLVVGAAKALAGNNRQVKEFTTMVMDGADGIAKINEVRGRSLVWNQLVQVNGPYTFTIDGLTITYSRGHIHIEGTTTASSGGRALGRPFSFVANHKYYLKWVGDKGGLTNAYPRLLLYNPTNSARIITATGSASYDHSFLIYYSSNTVINADIEYEVIDLTKMFGAGNEPTTVEEFEAMFPLPYYEYNPGEIISNKTASIGVTGRNVWDEEWESGMYSSTGGKQIDNTAIRSVNFIPVFPNTVYYYNKSSVRILAYNSKKQFLSMIGNALIAGTFTTPEDCHYLLFAQRDEAVYQNDICINLSDPSRNGTYEPYKHADISLNLSTITGKLNGEGESVVIFPNGMRSAGSAYDYLIVDEDGYARRAVKRMESVDLGTLEWRKGNPLIADSNYSAFRIDPSQLEGKSGSRCICNRYVEQTDITNFESVLPLKIGFSAKSEYLILGELSSRSVPTEQDNWLNGVELVYELATPLEYVLDEPIPMTFMAYHGGTMTQTPQAPDSAPMVINVTFAIDAVSTLIGLPEDYVSKASLQAMLSQMQSAGIIGSYTMAYNATAGRYDFTFTKPTTE